MKKFAYIISFCHLLVFALSLATDWYLFLSLVLFVSLLAGMIDKLGKGIVWRELVAAFGCFICLLMPALGYSVYNQSYLLSKSFLRFMMVPENTYFQFTLPAMSAFTLALCWPVRKSILLDEGKSVRDILSAIKVQLTSNRYVGFWITGMGLVALLVTPLLPESIRFVFALIYFSAFVGILYIYLGPNFRYKRLILLLFIAFIVINSIRSGVFTIFAYMSITLLSFVFVGRKVSVFTKVFFLVIGIFVLVVIQSVKQTYRVYTWTGNYTGNKISLFGDLVSERLSNTEEFFSKSNFFTFYYRANQGFNISLVMRRIPTQQPFDNGNYLAESFVSALVPRFIWPNKPKAGGEYNMEHYAGRKIVGWSTNISPLGEAYGNFGVVGGIIYMFILGLLIRFAYRRVFVLAMKTPLLLLWIPVLFYQVTYCMETDSLQVYNSLIKASILIWVLMKLKPSWFLVANEKLKKFTPSYSLK